MNRNKVILSLKTFLTYSLGCRTNQAEMENISLQLMDYGLRQAINEKPDIVLLNTCVVTAKAEKETRKEIRKLRKLFPKSFLIVLGCAVTAKEKFKISLPEADLLIPNPKKEQALKLILTKVKHPLKHFNFTHDRELFYNVSKLNKLPRSKPTLSADKLTRYPPAGGKFVSLLPSSRRFGGFSASRNKYFLSGRKFIKIQDGCSCNCSFCITTLLRGQPISVSHNKIIKEIKFWVHKKINEVILTGINIALYGMDDINTNIITLLKTILKETTIKKISFSSIYPEMLTKDLLNLVIENPRITHCFHLSLQSGSPTVLERMNRKTDLNKLSQAIKYLRKHIPDFTIRADIIIGFPNETDKEFDQTLNLLKELKISFVHVFPFSKRIGTMAYQNIKSKKWQDLPEKVKKQRAVKITDTVRDTRKHEAIKLFNNVSNCLIIRLLSIYLAEGITENGWPIIIQSSKLKVKSLKGKILPVKITDFKNDQLFGEILSLPT